MFIKVYKVQFSIFFSVASSVLSPAAWPVPAHSVAICEGLEDWGAVTDLSNISDSDEEDQPAPLVRFWLP